MPLEEVIAGYTFTGFATTPPTIPGLQAMGIFGSSKDGINANRAPGGPAFSNMTTPPTIGAAWITVNNGTATSTPTVGIDSGLAETTPILASGWTWFCVGRTLGTGGINASLLSIGPGQATGLVLNPQNASLSNHPSVYATAQGIAMNTDAVLDLVGISLANWRMYALTYPAGSGARPYTIYDVTGGASKVSTITHSRALVGTTNHFTFGWSGNALPANIYQQCDVAAGGFCIQPLTLAQLQTIRTWLTGVLAVRSVTGF